MSKVKQFKDMTVDELKAEALGCYQAVWINDCFGTRDVRNFEGAVQELEKRGYEIKEHTYIKISDEPVPQEAEDLPVESICNECSEIDGCEAWNVEPQTEEDHVTYCNGFSAWEESG